MALQVVAHAPVAGQGAVWMPFPEVARTQVDAGLHQRAFVPVGAGQAVGGTRDGMPRTCRRVGVGSERGQGFEQKGRVGPGLRAVHHVAQQRHGLALAALGVKGVGQVEAVLHPIGRLPAPGVERIGPPQVVERPPRLVQLAEDVTQRDTGVGRLQRVAHPLVVAQLRAVSLVGVEVAQRVGRAVEQQALQAAAVVLVVRRVGHSQCLPGHDGSRVEAAFLPQPEGIPVHSPPLQHAQVVVLGGDGIERPHAAAVLRRARLLHALLAQPRQRVERQIDWLPPRQRKGADRRIYKEQEGQQETPQRSPRRGSRRRTMAVCAMYAYPFHCVSFIHFGAQVCPFPDSPLPPRKQTSARQGAQVRPATGTIA